MWWLHWTLPKPSIQKMSKILCRRCCHCSNLECTACSSMFVGMSLCRLINTILMRERRRLMHICLSNRVGVWQNGSFTSFLSNWVRIQKPVVTYDVVSYYRKAVCSNLFAALPNIFYHLNFTILLSIADVMFEVEIKYLRSKTIERLFQKVIKFIKNYFFVVWQSSTVGHTGLTRI
jgi:hypothetical protein